MVPVLFQVVRVADRALVRPLQALALFEQVLHGLGEYPVHARAGRWRVAVAACRPFVESCDVAALFQVTDEGHSCHPSGVTMVPASCGSICSGLLSPTLPASSSAPLCGSRSSP